MSDQLSSDLQSLKIDRAAASAGGGGGMLRWLVVLVVLGGLGWAAYAHGLPYVASRFLKTEVAVTEILSVSPSQAAVELTSTGYVEPQVISRVAPKVPGRVAKAYVKEGDHVEQGALLLELEQADRDAAIRAAQSRAAAAQARVAAARANLAEAKLQAERARKLAQQGVAPTSTADDLEARTTSLAEAVKSAMAEVKAADAEVAALRVDLQYMSVRAPIAGTVVNDPPDVGELVGSDLLGGGQGSDQVVEIADFSTLMVETDVPEGRLHMIEIGSPCEIALDAFPGRRYRGEAVEVSPRVDRAKATVEVKVKFVDAVDNVLPDMSARVSFLSAPLDEAALKAQAKTVVPERAIAERNGAKVVFVLEDDAVRMRMVTLGERVGDGYELQEGPAPGTRVVASPPETLADGQRVKEKI